MNLLYNIPFELLEILLLIGGVGGYILYRKLRAVGRGMKSPFSKWRGELTEVRAYLEEGGMKDVGYSPDEGISGYAMSAAKSLDTLDEGMSTHGGYISGIYRDYPLQLSTVDLQTVDSKESTQGALIGGMRSAMGIGGYSEMGAGYHSFFSGTWYIFPVKRKCKRSADLFIVDQWLVEADGFHGPGRTTGYAKCRLDTQADGRYDIFLSDTKDGTVRDYLDERTEEILMRFGEKYRLLVYIVGSKVHIGVADRQYTFGHSAGETAEEWRAKQTFFADLDELISLVDCFGAPPSEDAYFF